MELCESSGGAFPVGAARRRISRHGARRLFVDSGDGARSVKGINFSGSRIGGTLAMPGVAWLIQQLGWHKFFFVLMIVGFVWAAFWGCGFAMSRRITRNVPGGT